MLTVRSSGLVLLRVSEQGPDLNPYPPPRSGPSVKVEVIDGQGLPYA